MVQTRKLSVIFITDMVGFSRLAAADEERTLVRFRGVWSDVIAPAIAAHQGRLVKRTGDGAIVEFRSVLDSVRCGLEVQRGIAECNAGVVDDKRLLFRIGIHVGDVIEGEDGDKMGDAVNIAARLESICDPGGLCLSGEAFSHVRGKLPDTFRDWGERQLKNIGHPVRALMWSDEMAEDGTRPRQRAGTRSLALPDKASIAVLPFQNMSGDPDQDYFADGIVEDIITGLCALDGCS